MISWIGERIVTAREMLRQKEHRPFPLPKGPWVMRQEWHDLLFAHWSIDPAALRERVPRPLEPDLWHEEGYISVTPFHLRGLRPPGFMALPGISHFREINVRTYVIFQGVPGIFFFSLDATNLSAVVGARVVYALPYYKARISIDQDKDAIRYHSQRLQQPLPAEFRVTYAATSGVLPWQSPGESLARFLSERYCLYAALGRSIYRVTIHHVPWPLQDATAEIEINSMTGPLNLTLAAQPKLLNFSKFLDVLVWWPERVA